ncbi:hypothetical protein V8F20_007470 [Naviculisporaceae sp. PSN 640]
MVLAAPLVLSFLLFASRALRASLPEGQSCCCVSRVYHHCGNDETFRQHHPFCGVKVISTWNGRGKTQKCDIKAGTRRIIFDETVAGAEVDDISVEPCCPVSRQGVFTTMPILYELRYDPIPSFAMTARGERGSWVGNHGCSV